jgi:hypothetical protein
MTGNVPFVFRPGSWCPIRREFSCDGNGLFYFSDLQILCGSRMITLLFSVFFAHLFAGPARGGRRGTF